MWGNLRCTIEIVRGTRVSEIVRSSKGIRDIKRYKILRGTRVSEIRFFKLVPGPRLIWGTRLSPW